tara:strand:+ start:318 stop:1691 length:1374 start_codon:yes stop_codon:yes gene_type:complete
MNYIFDYFFSNKFINGFDINKIPSNTIDKNLDADYIFTKSTKKFKDRNSVGVWSHPNEMNSPNTTFYSVYEILDNNNFIKEEYKDKKFFYKLDLFGSPAFSFPDNRDTMESIIDFTSYRVIDALKKNDNLFLLMSYYWEGILAEHTIMLIHSKMWQYQIPTKKVVLSFGGFNQKEWYQNICDKHKIKNKINFHYHNWVWKTKGEEFWEYKNNKEYDKINSEYKIEKKKYDFNCLNRRLRTHRFYVLSRLEKEKLLDDNIVTYDFTIVENRPHLAEIPKIEQVTHEFDFTELKSYLLYLQKYKDKKFYDYDDLENLHGIMHERASVYENSMFSFVTETTYYSDEFYISEKTLKPIGHKHPFIIFGSVGTLKELQRMGFKTFEPFIDESYDLETNMQRRIDMIFDEVLKLVNKTDEEKLEWMKNIKPIVDWNSKKLEEIYFESKNGAFTREKEIFKLIG